MKIVQKYITQLNTAPNTGELLKVFIKKKRLSKAALSRTLNRATNTLVGFIKGKTIQTAVLWEICHALKHNFFADIAAQLPNTYSNNISADTTKDERIAELEQEVALIKAKNEVLLEAMKR